MIFFKINFFFLKASFRSEKWLGADFQDLRFGIGESAESRILFAKSARRYPDLLLEKAAEIIKKDQGITLDSLTNREKAIVIDALRNRYTLKELLKAFHMAKSSYCYQMAVLKAPDKYESTREDIRNIFSSSGCTYGYRRIHQAMKNAGKTIVVLLPDSGDRYYSTPLFTE